MADKSGLSRPTVYAALPGLTDRKLVVEKRKLGASRLYAINVDNPLIQSVLTKDFERSRAAAEVESRARKQKAGRNPVPLRRA